MKVRDLEWWIVGIVGFIAFTLSIKGFNILFTEAGVERNYIDLAFQAIKTFGMEFTDGFKSPLPWQLEVSRWLSPAVMLYIAGKTILFLIRREFKSSLIKFKKNHIIITALNQKSRHLITDLLANGETVVVVAAIEDPRKLDIVEKEGAIIVEGDILSDKFLKNIAAHKAKYMVFIENDDEKNISTAISVYNFIVKCEKNKKQTLYTHVGDDLKLNELKELNFFEELTEQNKLNLNCEIRIFSAHERASRILFLKYSPDVFTKINSPKDQQINIAIIGSKTLAQSMIIRFARLGHYANLKKMKITLFHDGKDIASKLERNFKNINDLIELETINEDLELFDADKFETIHKNHPFTSTYILCEDDSLSSAILNKLTKVETEKELDVILTLINPDGILSKRYIASKIDSINLHKFNIIEESFTQDALISEKLDELAKIIHNDYLSGLKTLNPDKSSHKPWKLLALDFKNQNREQADHIFVKLRALGYGAENYSEIIFTDEQVELLSEMEHNRWWANMALSGWKNGAKRDDKKKIHTDLIPYEQLPEETKQYDRDAVLNIPKLLEKMER
ncbi:MAG: hypothetical protein DRJ10_13620 [Bacteroidetes bacterium]|nr:MAG: hypothetical protein DRJ10_13620 [Bacteroidota bacterium]